MKITQLTLKDYTVFDEMAFCFSEGINVFLGENSTGKTHILKLLYAAGSAANEKESFPHKLVNVMLPDGYQISRLARRQQGGSHADICVRAQEDMHGKPVCLRLSFHNRTKKWAGEVTGEKEWERSFPDSQQTFIPAKEVLSNNYNLRAAVGQGNVRFDDTYLDILDKAKINVAQGRNEAKKNRMLGEIEQIIKGRVVYEANRDAFYLRVPSNKSQKQAGSKQEFNLLSEGVRKMALLWQLVKNGMLAQNSILYWDEPEGNLNPACIPVIVRLLFALQQQGVQIFLATHDYFLAKYLSLRAGEDGRVLFHSLYISDARIREETAVQFEALEHNPVMQAFRDLYHEEAGVAL